jgi:hypothetical protein
MKQGVANGEAREDRQASQSARTTFTIDQAMEKMKEAPQAA